MLNLSLRNFMSIKLAELKASGGLTVVLGPNRSGKTQILHLIYSILWSAWKSSVDGEDFEKTLTEKLKRVFLVNSVSELISWEKKDAKVNFSCGEFSCGFEIKNGKLNLTKLIKKETSIKKPIYLLPGGLGDYYKGIHSLRKYYPRWKLVSEAVTDLVEDLFIVSESKANGKEPLLKDFENSFNAKFYVQRERIFIQERGKNFGIERTASGLKSLSWLYLILKYGMLEDLILLDEPEVNLHPVYLEKLARFLVRLSEKFTVIVVTHSDYLTEAINTILKKQNLKSCVWEAKLAGDLAIYSSYEADAENPIDTKPLTDVFLNILREQYE